MSAEPKKKFPSTTHDEWVLNSVKALLQRPIAYHPALAEQMGSVAGGVFASQLLYWSSRTNARWFYKTDEEIRQETRLTERELKAAKRNLANVSFIDSERKGMPAKTWYSVNLPQLLEVLGDTLDSVQSSSDDGVQTGQDGPVPTCSDDGVQTTPETTSETTSKRGGARVNGAHSLPEDWEPAETIRIQCRDMGLSDSEVEWELGKFRDHWQAATKNAKKKDWGAAFRNWCRKAVEFKGQRPGSKAAPDEPYLGDT